MSFWGACTGRTFRLQSSNLRGRWTRLQIWAPHHLEQSMAQIVPGPAWINGGLGQSHHKAVRQSWHSPAQEKNRPWLLRVQFSQNKSCQRWHKARMMEIIGQWRILYSFCWMQASMAMASSIETAKNRSFHPICSRRSTWMAAWFLRGPNLPNLLKLKQRKIQWAICLISSSLQEQCHCSWCDRCD